MSKRQQSKRSRNGSNKKLRSKGDGYIGSKSNSSAYASFYNNSKRGGFPDVMRVKMVYTDNPTLSSATVTAGYQVYRGNGIFDPDFTGTGLQPALYDDYSTIYNQYRVLGAKIIVTGVSSSATTIGRYFLCARNTSTGTAAATAFMGACANPYTVDGMVGPNGITGNMENKAGLGQSAMLNVSTAQILGLTRQGVQGSDNVASVFSTTPNEPWYFHLAAIHQDLATSATYRFIITIEYDVEWFDQVTQSLDLDQQLIRLEKRLRDKQIREEKFLDRHHNREGFEVVPQTINPVPHEQPSHTSSVLTSTRVTLSGPPPLRRF